MKPKSKLHLLTGLVGLELLSLLLMGCGERTNSANYYPEPVEVPAPGSYSKELTINDFTLEDLSIRPYLRDYVGYWELKLEDTGRFSVSNSNLIFEGLYKLSTSEITFYGTNWLHNCFYSQKADEINYQWDFSGDKLNLISLQDDCFERSLVLTAQSWVPTNTSPQSTPVVGSNA